MKRFQSVCACACALVACGGSFADDAALGTPDASKDAIAKKDASTAMDATIDSETDGGFLAIDTTTWLDTGASNGACSFVAVGGKVQGDKVITFVGGGEIPCLYLGCSGMNESAHRVTFLGKVAIDGTSTIAPQFAWLDIDQTSFFVDNVDIAQCDLNGSLPSGASLGDPASGTFVCTAMPSTSSNVTASVSAGQYASFLTTPAPIPN